MPLLWWYLSRQKGAKASLTLPGMSLLADSRINWLARSRHLLFLLRCLAIASAVVALARPRTAEENTRSGSTEGIDIMMAIDVSLSMLAQDLRPNRLKATKKVAQEFVEQRASDRIGLVVYAGESYTQTPLTTDHRILINAIEEVKHGLIEDGTAIGMGLATAVNRLKDSKAKSKVAILLTDGDNNRGNIDPLTAAQLAREFNVRVYTIGVGTKGMARQPVRPDGRGGYYFTRAEVRINEDLLKEIAQETGGRYFRATDNQKLKEIYSEIDQLERTKLQEMKFYTYDEKFDQWALLALGLLLLEQLLRFTVYKSFV